VASVRLVVIVFRAGRNPNGLLWKIVSWRTSAWRQKLRWRGIANVDLFRGAPAVVLVLVFVAAVWRLRHVRGPRRLATVTVRRLTGTSQQLNEGGQPREKDGQEAEKGTGTQQEGRRARLTTMRAVVTTLAAVGVA